MFCKSFEEMYKVDVKPHLEYRDGIAYLPWAMCKKLLHDNGAKKVFFEPLVDEQTGSTLFGYSEKFADKKGLKNACYEVRVKVTIDDLVFIQNYPVLNGTAIVRDDTMNQLRVSNAQARAFVKGVAIHTGLGFSLWVNDSELEEQQAQAAQTHDIETSLKMSISILANQYKMDVDSIAHAIGADLEEFKAIFNTVKALKKIEKNLDNLVIRKNQEQGA